MKDKKKPVTLTPAKIKKIVEQAASEATEKAFLLMMAAASDEFNLDDNQLVSLYNRVDRYAGHLDNHLVKISDIIKAIEEKTGAKLRNF